MGYTSNCLPEAVAKLGHEVHAIAPNVQVYFNSPFYDQTYREFLGDPITKIETKEIGNFTLHRLPHKKFKTEVDIVGLKKLLSKLKPDIVHVFQLNSIITIRAFFYKFLIGYRFFFGNHTVLSVFPLDKEWPYLPLSKKIIWSIKHITSGRIISLFAEKCFPATIDAKYIANKYFGVPNKKMELAPIGIDTEKFTPNDKNKEKSFLIQTNQPNSFICIYTGRFTEQKNPLILAKAIEKIKRKYKNIFGVFIGNGPQIEQIKKCQNCKVFPFMPSSELVKFYQNSDVGVWPREESMSMLDAMSCGLPLIVSNKLKAKERIDGNGLTYEENNFSDLAEQIEKLFLDKNLYNSFSEHGRTKAINNFSWNAIAKKRILNYEVALQAN